MHRFSPQRWNAAIDILVLTSMFISLAQSLVNGSDQPAMTTFAAVGLVWALRTGAWYVLDLVRGWRGKKLQNAVPLVDSSRSAPPRSS